MSVSYKKLWKLLIDKDMTKMELREAIGVSTATIARMSKDMPASTEVMMKICKVLDCDIGDIMAITRDKEQNDSTESQGQRDNVSTSRSGITKEMAL